MAESRLTFELFGRDKASPVFDRFGRQVEQTDRKVGLLESSTRKLVGAAAGYIAFSTAADFLRSANEEARESQKVNAQTTQVIKTTGGAAKVTAKDVGELATRLSMKTAIDDEQVQSSTNLLLTFKQVRNEVGEGAKILDRATAAALDLSASGFGSTDAAAKMLGKSLNDPLKGLTALGRAGVTFSEDQKKQIKSLVQQNDLLGAQKIILKEVESQVGGQAQAQATAAEKAEVAWANVKETIGTALLPTIDRLSEKFVDFVENHDIEGWAETGADKLEDFGEAMAPLAKDVLPAVGTALSIAADGAERLAPAVQAVVDAFNNMPGWAQTALVGGGAAATVLPMPSLPGRGGKGSPGGDGSDKKGSPGKGGKKGGIKGPGLIGTVATAVGLGAAVDDLGGALDSLGDGSANVDRLAQSFDRAGKSTEITGMILSKAFADGSVGRYAEELGFSVDDLTASLAKSGSEGKTYKDTLSQIDERMVDLVKAGDVGDEFFALGDFRNQLTDVAESTDDARGRAKGFASILGTVGDKAEDGAHALDVLGDKKARPSVKAVGIGGTLGAIGDVRSDLASLNGDQATVYIKAVKTGASIGGIAAQLAALPGRAAGGPIIGPGSKTSDDVLFWGSNGEHVLSGRDVDAMGGQAGVHEFRRRLHDGRAAAQPVATPSVAPSMSTSAMERLLAEQNQLLRQIASARGNNMNLTALGG